MARAEFERPITPGQAEVFAHWFPGAQITAITPEVVPTATLEIFEYRSRCFIDPATYEPLNFSALYLITHKDGSRTFAASQTKVLSNGPEESTYVVDISDNQEILGYSELRYCFANSRKFFRGKPFEQWSGTEKGRRGGLSTRRIFVMNALSQMIYGLPLYSSTHFIHDTDEKGERIQPQKLVWEKFVREGLARKFKERGQDRFVFTGQK